MTPRVELLEASAGKPRARRFLTAAGELLIALAAVVREHPITATIRGWLLAVLVFAFLWLFVTVVES